MRAFKASIGERVERCGAITRCVASVCMEDGARRVREKKRILT